MLAGAVGAASISVTTAARPSDSVLSTTRPRNSVPDDRLVAQHAAGLDPAVRGEQRQARRGPGAAGRAVHLAVGEHGDVALARTVAIVAEVLEDDRPVDARLALVARVAGVLAGVERPLDLAAERDQLRRAARA